MIKPLFSLSATSATQSATFGWQMESRKLTAGGVSSRGLLNLPEYLVPEMRLDVGILLRIESSIDLILENELGRAAHSHHEQEDPGHEPGARMKIQDQIANRHEALPAVKPEKGLGPLKGRRSRTPGRLRRLDERWPYSSCRNSTRFPPPASLFPQ